MRYGMHLLTEEGQRYPFDGHKEIRTRGARHAWSEMTTLYTMIAGPDGAKLGTGILHLQAVDFTRLVRTSSDPGVPHLSGRVPAGLPGALRRGDGRVYGGVLDEPGAFPSAPKKAPAVRVPGRPARGLVVR